MASLLHQLQKSKRSSRASVGDVLLQGDDMQSGDDAIDARVAEAERLLDNLIGESEDSLPGSSVGAPGKGDEPDPFDSAKFRVVRHRRSSSTEESRRPTESDSGLPWWLSDQRRISSQAEQLLPVAQQKLVDVLPEHDQMLSDLVQHVSEAVSLATEALRQTVRISKRDRDYAEQELLQLLQGRGRLTELYEDKSVTEIYIDGHKSIRAMRRGVALETPFSFRSADEYQLFLRGLLASGGQVLNEEHPIAECVLDDQWNSRIHAVHQSLLQGGEPRVVIRIPRQRAVAFYDLLQSKILPPTLAAWLAELVGCREANLLVVGPAGSGKSLMTAALVSAVGTDERVIIVEEIPEILVPTVHSERLIPRPAGVHGEHGVATQDLVQAAIRRAPHRIVLGEMLGAEAGVFLRGLESGFRGCIATLNGDNADDGIWRMIDLIASYERCPIESIMRRIARSIQIVVTMTRVNDEPCLLEVAEVSAPEANRVLARPIVQYRGIANGRRVWQIATGESDWVERLESQFNMTLRAGPGLIAYAAALPKFDEPDEDF